MSPICRIADVIFVLVALGTVLIYPQFASQVVPVAVMAWGLTLLGGAVKDRLASNALLVLGVFSLLVTFLALVLLSRASSGDVVIVPLLFGNVGAI